MIQPVLTNLWLTLPDLEITVSHAPSNKVIHLYAFQRNPLIHTITIAIVHSGWNPGCMEIIRNSTASSAAMGFSPEHSPIYHNQGHNNWWQFSSHSTCSMVAQPDSDPDTSGQEASGWSLRVSGDSRYISWALLQYLILWETHYSQRITINYSSADRFEKKAWTAQDIPHTHLGILQITNHISLKVLAVCPGNETSSPLDYFAIMGM